MATLRPDSSHPTGRPYDPTVPVARLSALARSPHGKKAIKYSMVSVVAVGCSQAILVICHGLLGMGFVASNVTAVAISSFPSYLLNRAWVWGRTGSHDMLREVAPFWIFSFVGLGFSTLLVHIASRWSDRTIVLSAANLTAFGILWIAKYVVLDALLFSALLGDDDEAEETTVLS
jgi:putative flippase GtrA